MNWKWQSEEKVDQISFGDVWFRLAPLDLDRSHIIRSSLPPNQSDVWNLVVASGSSPWTWSWSLAPWV